MTQSNAKEWPKSAVETLDQEIGTRIRRLSDGTATAQDVSEATRLIRERADYMMPGIFQRLRQQRAEKKAS
ncbi:hypothetical protein [Beijerinckia indica]|uniref:Uncharacterized protein n=1 Tax=Beijerinckia indica subsp. indica (strain ATCC 9039 / DSM 1715 / NCIMB 8712) TaxID=395963 RepID=B2ICY2_BEII9|nr:hypothetical protein [Beijerinckia indica]ACB96750.1 hypothetical protein Bind_3190 [Beijerinckia indica subsp. indica ATCC 9039]